MYAMSLLKDGLEMREMIRLRSLEKLCIRKDKDGMDRRVSKFEILLVTVFVLLLKA
jgi:hypothetical protein